MDERKNHSFITFYSLDCYFSQSRHLIRKGTLLKRQKNSHLSDAELIELAKKNRQDFGLLYEKYFDQIFRFSFKRLGGNEDVAAELTQMTFIKAMDHIHAYEDRGFPFSAWLYRIAQNEISMYFRKSKRQYEVPVDENRIKDLFEEAEIDGFEKIEQQKRLIELLNNLPQEHLDLIELRFFQQMSFKEISEIYNISEANAKMKVYRILEKMNKIWTNLK